MKDITLLREELDTGKVTSEELFKESNLKAHKYQEEFNSFVTIIDEYKKEESNSLINGIPYALKDNFSTKGILSTSSSNILKDYVPVYDATVYKKLKEAGAVLVGKTVLDELAMGGTGTTGHTGIVKNPWDKERQIGGSSAGSASSVALGIVPFSIGSDTGDSIRKPASFGGIVGFKPTYGRISRYGLFAFASSLDHVGCFTRCVRDAAIVTDILKGKDERDMTSLPNENIKYTDMLENEIKGKKLFYIKEITDLDMYKDAGEETLNVLSKFKETIEKCKELGFIVEEVRNDIKNKWGEDVYIAAIDAEFIENIVAQEDANDTSTSEDGRKKRKRVRVTSNVAIALNHLINNPLITIGAKEEKGKFKNARQKAKQDKKTQQKEQEK